MLHAKVVCVAEYNNLDRSIVNKLLWIYLQMLSQFTSTTVCHDYDVAAFDLTLQMHQLLQPSQYLGS